MSSYKNGILDMSITKAIQFATERHDGQMRKYMDVPYIDHPLYVMHRVLHDVILGGCKEYAIIAVLHDVVEDTTEDDSNESRNKLYNEIGLAFSYEILGGVRYLTNEYTSQRYPNDNRQHRHTVEVNRLTGVPETIKIIKLYDRLANLEDCLQTVDKMGGFAKKYAEESWTLADKLYTEHNAYLAHQVLTLAQDLHREVS